MSDKTAGGPSTKHLLYSWLLLLALRYGQQLCCRFVARSCVFWLENRRLLFDIAQFNVDHVTMS